LQVLAQPAAGHDAEELGAAADADHRQVRRPGEAVKLPLLLVPGDVDAERPAGGAFAIKLRGDVRTPGKEPGPNRSRITPQPARIRLRDAPVRERRDD